MASGLTAIPLGKMEKVRVRDVWPDEARNFTPWLAGEGIAELSEELGFDLRILNREYAVGRYSLDILATTAGADEDEDSSGLVVIENQFGPTDHDHLGKLMTYASGVGAENQGAKTVIWISEEFREEHRRALEWLNEVTQSGIRFYGVQVELYRIGGSATAPSFNVLVRPNEVVRARRRDVARQVGDSERDLFYIDYWTAFKEYCSSHEAKFRLQSPRPSHALFAPLGRSGVHLTFIAARRDGWIGCELTINDVHPEATFAELGKDRATIDAELPGLIWEHKEDIRKAKIYRRKDTPPGNRSLWSGQHEWLLDQGNRFFSVFAPRVRSLK